MVLFEFPVNGPGGPGRPADGIVVARRRVVRAMGLLGAAAFTGCGDSGGSGSAPAAGPTVPTLTMESDATGLATGPVTVKFRFSDDVGDFRIGSFSVVDGTPLVDTFTRISPREYSVRIVTPRFPQSSDQSVSGRIRVEVPPFEIRDGSRTIGTTARYRFYQPYRVPARWLVDPSQDWISFSVSPGDRVWTVDPWVITIAFNVDLGPGYFTVQRMIDAIRNSYRPTLGCTISEVTLVSDRVYSLKVTPLPGARSAAFYMSSRQLGVWGVVNPDEYHEWLVGWSSPVPGNWVKVADHLGSGPWSGDQPLTLSVSFSVPLTRPLTSADFKPRASCRSCFSSPEPAFTVSELKRVSDRVYTLKLSPPADFDFAEQGGSVWMDFNAESLGVQAFPSDTLQWETYRWTRSVWGASSTWVT